MPLIRLCLLGLFLAGAATSVARSQPLVPMAGYVVEKEVDRPRASAGDRVQYSITVFADDPIPDDVYLRDVLPRGFRLLTNTVLLAGEPPAAGQLSETADGFVMLLGRLDPGAALSLVYTAEVTAAAPARDAMNIATVEDGAGSNLSNTARALVRVDRAFFDDAVTIAGQVTGKSCDSEQDRRPLPGIQLVLETGDRVRTDKFGRFHFPQTAPGTHVVRVDPRSIPAGWQLADCEGMPIDGAIFVDVRPGAVARADFHLTRNAATPDPIDEVSVVPAADDDRPTTQKALSAAAVEARSRLIADGVTAPIIGLRITGEEGMPVETGKVLRVKVQPPHGLPNPKGGAPLSRGIVNVGPGGMAQLELAPTYVAGEVRLHLQLDNGREQRIRVVLAPQSSSWLLSGLVEWGEKSGQSLSPDDLLSDQKRGAVYATGMLGEDWLATLGYDSEREDAPGRRRGFRQQPNLDQGYQLFADGSLSEVGAPSRYPLFLSLTNGQTSAVFGDYDTGLNGTDLSAYRRRLSGGKARFAGEVIDLTAFTAETPQQFRRDELNANGTSGPYRLTTLPIILQSERIKIETRDRFRPDIVLAEELLERFVDYDLDPVTGRLIFREPIPAADIDLNPNIIVAEYEVNGEAGTTWVSGGRAGLRLFGGRMETGISFIDEQGDAIHNAPHRQLMGFDLAHAFTDRTVLEAEYARSLTELLGPESAGGDPSTDGEAQEAIKLELHRYGNRARGAVYFHRQDDDFGLEQTSRLARGVQRVGAKGTIALHGEDGEESNRKKTPEIALDLYREDAIDREDWRESATVAARQYLGDVRLETGLRHVSQARGAVETSGQSLTLGLNKNFSELKTTVDLQHEVNIAGSVVGQFARRSGVALNRKISKQASAFMRLDHFDGEDIDALRLSAGGALSPWEGGKLHLETDQTFIENTERLNATFGLDQKIELTERWQLTMGGAQRLPISVREGDGEVSLLDDPQFLLRTPTGAAPTFSSGYAGVAWRQDRSRVATRVELFDGEDDRRLAVTLTGVRDVSEQLSYAMEARVDRRTDAEGALMREAGRLRLGLARRPQAQGPLLLSRLDLETVQSADDERGVKLIHNAAAQFDQGPVDLSIFGGAKYIDHAAPGEGDTAAFGLLGMDTRAEVWRLKGMPIDLGVSGSALVAGSGHIVGHQYGPSLGIRPDNRLWLSMGYNFAGYDEEDFDNRDVSREGLFVKLRFRFDERDIGRLSQLTSGQMPIAQFQ